MTTYLHGAYGQTQAVGSRAATLSSVPIVAVGTAPVHQIGLKAGDHYRVNEPVLVNNIAEARKYFSYSDDWEKYTLCEAMHAILEESGVGPLVLINVLDPTLAAHKGTAGSATPTPANGRAVIASAGEIILDSVVVKKGASGSQTTLVKDTDYSIAYNYAKQEIILAELTAGVFGTDALTVTYDVVDPSAVTSAHVIGSSDGAGTNTGLYAVNDVYQKTGGIPAYLMAPGWSSVKAVHDAMAAVSRKVSGHWDAFLFSDLPLLDGSTPITLASAKTYKNANGYTLENEKVFFPLAYGTDGKTYHLSVLYAANFLHLLAENDGIPYHSASNTECALIANLYLGANTTGRVYDDALINEKLTKCGITSACYAGGRWALWGPATAGFDADSTSQDDLTRAETNIMMLYYVSNDFQNRRARDVDKPLSANDILTIVSEEQARLDALIRIGALIYGTAELDADAIANSDMYQGDYAFTFHVTTTPLAKSLTAIVNWVDDGFATWFEALTA